MLLLIRINSCPEALLRVISGSGQKSQWDMDG